MSDSFPTTFGRYTLTERLALGGMAELFLAESSGARGFAKTVVIKRILPHLAADERFVEMFVAEAKITARLDHPKIAQTFDLGLERNQLYIAMEYIDGLDGLALLRECAHKRVRVPAEISTYIAKEILDALDFAHNLADDEGRPLGIVHRDVSPSNVLLSKRGDVKLVDFGIAHAAISEGTTQTGTLKGKYGYMSPEQIEGVDVDARSDLFSVGVVLSELLMGRRLFAAANELDVLLMVRDVNLERLARFGGPIPSDLKPLVLRALQKDPAKRFADAAEFRDALDEWLYAGKHRVGPKRVSEVVLSLHDVAEARRKARMANVVVPEHPGPETEDASAELIAIAANAAGRDPGGPRLRSERPATDADEPALMEEIVAENAAAADSDGIPSGAISGDESIEIFVEEGSGSLDIALEEEGSAPTPSGARAVATGESVGFDSISAAVASLSPQDPDPASRDFDDSRVAESGESGESPRESKRMPTADEIRSRARRDSDRPDIPGDPATQGDFAQTPALEVLFARTAERATGLLVVSQAGIRKEIYYRQGQHEYVSSNVASELFGTYLVREKVLSPAELDMALAVMPHFGGKLGDTLVGLGLMKPLEVFRHLTEQVCAKIADIVGWQKGLYTWYPGRENPRAAFPLSIDPLEVYGTGAMALTLEFLDDWIAHNGGLLLKHSESKVAPEHFRLGAIARKVHQSLDGTRTLAQIRNSNEELDYLRVCYLLYCTRLAVDIG